MVSKAEAQFELAPFLMKVNQGHIRNQRQAPVPAHYAFELDLVDIEATGRLTIRPRGWEVLLREPARRFR